MWRFVIYQHWFANSLPCITEILRAYIYMWLKNNLCGTENMSYGSLLYRMKRLIGGSTANTKHTKTLLQRIGETSVKFNMNRMKHIYQPYSFLRAVFPYHALLRLIRLIECSFCPNDIDTWDLIMFWGLFWKFGWRRFTNLVLYWVINSLTWP